MNSLFPAEPNFPEGFHYFPEFITEVEEQQLIKAIQEQELHTFLFQGFEAKRKVASFGFDYSFDRRKLSAGKPIPQSFLPVIEQVAQKIGIAASAFQEILLTEYPPGAAINWHRDAPPFNFIAGISLASDCVFKLRPHEETKRSRNSVISFPVQRRSLYIISGVSRTDWQHSTTAAVSTRYSITLRTLRQ